MTGSVRLLRWSDADRRDLEARLGAASDDRVEPGGDAGALLSATLPIVPNNRERARTLYEQRKARRHAFGERAGLFQEPAWDILLELYISHQRGVAQAATSVAYATGVPISTTLRWMRRLSAKGLVRSVQDAEDARVRRVQLTPDAVATMGRYLEGV